MPSSEAKRRCDRAYYYRHWTKHKRWRDSNKEKIRRRNRIQHDKNYYQRATEKQAILFANKTLPCLDCEKFYPPWVLELDHTRGKKKFSIASGTTSVPLPEYEKELAKCDVVCANCHKTRTYRRYVQKHFGSKSARQIDTFLEGE
jgi:hypothetical protein